MTTTPELDTSASVLGFIRGRRAEANAAEVDVLRAAVQWAVQHPPESIHETACWPNTTPIGGETGLALAGEGAPLVAEFCLAELGAALGTSTDSARVLVAHGLELTYRLPRHHTRVMSGKVPVWRARRIAEQTMSLSPEAAAYVDAQVAGFAHRIGPAALDRLVTTAIAQFMPERAEADARAAAEGRHVTFFHDQLSFDGTTRMEAELDLADALDLDAAIRQEAEALAAAGCSESLDARRAIATGVIARRQLTLDLTQDEAPRAVKARQVVLYVHLAEDAITGQTGIARVENNHRLVTTDQIKTWCATPDVSVVVKPVIDLNDHIHVQAYEVPDRLAKQTRLRDVTCAFPWCARPARACETDHVIPHARGGPTSTDNLAPLCKRHHRLKTHARGWTYTALEPGTYLWTSPHGYQFLRDHTGTTDVSRDQPTRPPDD